MPTLQSTFDTVARHLLAQNAVSRYVNGCAYRGAHGRKCAVGCLISDEEYDSRMEGGAIMFNKPQEVNSQLVAAWAVKHGYNLALLAYLQSMHDGGCPEQWSAHLRGLAEGLGLATSVLDEFPDRCQDTERVSGKIVENILRQQRELDQAGDLTSNAKGERSANDSGNV